MLLMHTMGPGQKGPLILRISCLGTSRQECTSRNVTTPNSDILQVFSISKSDGHLQAMHGSPQKDQD